MAVLKVGGNSGNCKSLMEEYHYCLAMPVSTRCFQLTALLTEAAPKDLKQLYSVLVEAVFGFRNRDDWGLFVFQNTYPEANFYSLKWFLAPDGPLMQVAYKLCEDPQALYNFPIVCLPTSTRHSMAQGIIPNFYSKKISYGYEGSLSAYLHLNAFEFFLFHFTHFIVNPSSKFQGDFDFSKPQDTLYCALLEDYLTYFLRKDGSLPVAPATPPSSTMTTPSPPKTLPTKAWATPNRKTADYSSICGAASFQSPTQPATQKPSLLKADAFLSGNTSPNDTSGRLHTHASSEIKTWISELFIEIITEMYLNHHVVDFPQKYSPLVETFVPNCHHVWIIRILVKHFHSFTNSMFITQNGPEFVIDPFSDLKSYLIPHYVQKQLLSFLKIVFQHWPLDSTFRAPLETWFSYIQPWRYTSFETEGRYFVSGWQKFITENLPFYAPFLQQVLLRLFRMDLTVVKNAYMLYRVTRLFNQTDLDTMIVEAERSYFGQSKLPNVRGLNSSNAMSPNFKSSFHSTLPNSELSLDNYVPLYSPEAISQVSRLLAEIISAQERIASHRSSIGSYEQRDQSFFSQVNSWFNDMSPNSKEPIKEELKLDNYLEESIRQLCEFFKIPMSSIEIRRLKTRNVSSLADTSFSNSIDEKQNDQDQALLKRLHLFGGNSATQKIIFKGNPDTQPTRTYEIDTLVKVFREISDCLNIRYAPQINELYNRSSVVGRMSQQIFAPPTIFPEITKSKDMMVNTQKEVHLPPRITLRRFASMYVIWMYIMYLALFYFLGGVHPVLTFLVLAILKVFMIFIRAIFHLHKVKDD